MPQELTEDNYATYMDGTSSVLIDFWATWCGPCMRMKPDFEAADLFMRKEFEPALTFLSVNVDEQETVVQKFADMGCAIKGLPTLLLIKNGKIVCAEPGYKNKERILLMIGTHFDLVKKTDDEPIQNQPKLDSDENDQSSNNSDANNNLPNEQPSTPAIPRSECSD